MVLFQQTDQRENIENRTTFLREEGVGYLYLLYVIGGR